MSKHRKRNLKTHIMRHLGYYVAAAIAIGIVGSAFIWPLIMGPNR